MTGRPRRVTVDRTIPSGRGENAVPFRRSPLVLAGLMAAAGGSHFAFPGAYDRLVPSLLGPSRPWVLGSGVAEIVAALLLVRRRTRRLGGWWTAALLVAVFPGNLKMALDAASWGAGSSGSGAFGAVVVWVRLPLQVPLVWWAWRQTRGSGQAADMSAPRAAGRSGRG